jgi:2-polyprenyl-6-methoxyphenol hydroxylase-like FAD-dependent oxidoreductase
MPAETPMPKVIVLGGGPCGLAAGMLLARDGHEVTLFERDPAAIPESPDDAWESWERKGVAQFHQPHFLQARVRHVLDAELPDVRDELLRAGAVVDDPVRRLPPAIADRERRPDDGRFVSVSARRPTTEYVLARAAASEPRLELRRGAEIAHLETRNRPSGVQVTGVRTDAGESIGADLVVDAMGRRSQLPRWLRDLGAGPIHEEAEDCGFVYYTQFFRVADGGRPELRTSTLLTPLGSLSILTLPGDRETWSVTLYISGRDRPLKALKDVQRWTAVVSACPLHAHWLDGEPITDVLPMGGVIDRYRRLNADGRPVLTGVALVGDAWACTNPSLGRGLALGLHHAVRLRDVVRSHGDDPAGFAAAWDAVTEAELTPWYRATVAVDRGRLAEIDAIRIGADRPGPGPPEGADAVGARFPLAAGRDPDVFRALLEIIGCLTLPRDVFARPELEQRILAATDGVEATPPPGPTREDVLQLVA